MRYTIALSAVTAFFILGCSGPGTTRLERPGFGVDMIDGTVTEDLDRGQDGAYDVEYGFTTQALSWSPIDPDATLDDEIDLQWTTMQALLEADGDLTAPTTPAFVTGTVSGQPSIGFETSVSGASLASTIFRCPEAGIQVTLNTAGLSVTDTQATTLASFSCKSTPLERVLAPKGYRLVARAEDWTLIEEEPEDQRRTWTRADEGVTIIAMPQEDLVVDSICEPTMGLLGPALDIDVDPKQSQYRDLPGGCQQDFAGRWTDGSGPVRIRVLHEGCGGDGYLLICNVETDEPLDQACMGLVSCE